jgi:hypothetical protein
MMNVFLGGSRKISQLNPKIRQRIDNVLSKGFAVLIGDAHGADKAIQKYLAQKGYRNVTVFCSGKECRNNIGKWKCELVDTNRTTKDFRFYAQKVARMSDDADYGFFLWDGKSKGTLNNIVRLLSRNRSALVYLSPRKTFMTIKDINSLNGVINQCDPKTAGSLRQVLKIREHLPTQQSQFDFA